VLAKTQPKFRVDDGRRVASVGAQLVIRKGTLSNTASANRANTEVDDYPAANPSSRDCRFSFTVIYTAFPLPRSLVFQENGS
jgi:hypothetical protein